MKCSNCDRESALLHEGEWIAAKSKSTTRSIDRGSYRESLTVTQYQDPVLMHVQICEDCLWNEAARTLRSSGCILAGALAFLTAIIAIAVTSPKAGPVLRYAGGGVYAALVAVLVAILGHQYLSVRKHAPARKDWALGHIAAVAANVAKRAGKDTIFTREGWQAARDKWEKDFGEMDALGRMVVHAMTIEDPPDRRRR